LKYIWEACRDAREGTLRRNRSGWDARPERKIMNNGLVDEEKNFIVPLLVIGIAVVMVLLIAGLFIPSSISTW
jgi:hypothetical protein